MIAVIADDITGAAEIAGIAYGYGLKVVLTRRVGEELPECDVLVCITNTRSLLRCEAINQSIELGRRLTLLGVQTLFKKTDSVLRGYVKDELEALLEATGKKGALLLPANPSLGRQIIDGIYYVNQQPITQTPFSYDPEFPAKSDKVLDLLGGGTLIRPQEPLSIASPLTIGNLSTEVELVDYTKQLTPDWIPAGGSSFFKAFVEHTLGVKPSEQPTQKLPIDHLLLICGSTLHHNALLKDLEERRVPLLAMPKDVFDGVAYSSTWIKALSLSYAKHPSLAITINQPVSADPTYAQRLKYIMAESCYKITRECLVKELVIEGGATAYEVIKVMGWYNFEVTGQLAAGIITLQPHEAEHLHVTLKPGSYAWPEKVLA